MNFLLTGATGFIGRRLIARLRERGHHVSLFTRRVDPGGDPNVGQYFWDMKGPAPVEPFRDADVVIHLAGEPVAQRWSDEVKQRIRESRVIGTRHLVEGMARAERRPRVLISSSASGYYGDRGDELLTEASLPGSGFLPEVCQAWETEASRAQSLGVRVAAIRTGIVLGQGGGALEKMLPPFKMGVGGKLGDGKQWMSWIHIDDLVELYRFAAESEGVSGPLNGVAPEPVRNAEFTQALARTLHRPAIFPVPKFALQVLFGEMSRILLESQRIDPQAVRAAGFEWRYPKLSAALAVVLG
jgi:uncharacterized protein (TIGR01777 family)